MIEAGRLPCPRSDAESLLQDDGAAVPSKSLSYASRFARELAADINLSMESPSISCLASQSTEPLAKL